jgi:filamentous hemagglutinin family protein
LVNGAFAASPAAGALPTAGQVVAGQASISQNGNAMNVVQGTDKAIINWNSFNIGSQASVRFQQPSSSSVVLNRVLAGEASQIHGSLSANGQVFLINPAGVVFGAGSKVDVGGLVASALDITNENFLAGRLQFQRNGAAGGITVQGQITVADRGLLALLAPTVKNEGILSARLGNVALAGGDKVTLSAGADGHLQVAVEPSTVKTLVENRQLIVAEGGQIIMTSKAADALSAGVVANSGTVQARTLQEREGRILLLADMAHGEVRHAGLLDASAPAGGNGGFVETSAARVSLIPGRRVTTQAANGRTGTWLIDPNDYTVAASGGNITGAQLSSDLGSTNVTISTATQGTSGGNGDIFVNDGVTWSSNNSLTLTAGRNIQINAPITATGSGAGLNLNFSGSDYEVKAPITLSGSSASLAINGQNYTLIHDMAALDNIDAGDLGGKYALAQSLDASGATYVTGLVGTSGAFTGTFAGLGNTISNLRINAPGVDNVGLFGSLGGGARVRDIGLVGSNITGNNNVGALAGASSGSITNAHAAGSVRGVWNTGGLVGILGSGGVVRRSYATGSVSGRFNVGGLVGENNGSLSNSYAESTAAGETVVGGWVGNNQFGSINDSYATGAASSSTTYAGGAVGYNSANISNVYASGRVTGGYGTGGLVGKTDIGTVSNSFWNTETSGWGSSAGGTGLTSSQMKALASFSPTWSISANGGESSVWRIYEGLSTPLLREFLTPVTATAVNNHTITYSGTPYSGGNGYTASGATPSAMLYAGSSQGAINVGSYQIALYSHQQGHDLIGNPTATLTINRAPLTITANDVSRIYNGNAYSGGNDVSYSGFVGGETASVLGGVVSYSGTSQGAINAGTYSITPSGLIAANYTISYSPGTLTVNPAPLVIDAKSVGKTYDGSAYGGGGGVNYSGFVNGEGAGVLTGTLNYGGTSQGAVNAGTYSIIPSGLAAANYAITFNGANLTVTPKAITVNADAQSKVYGSADPVLGWQLAGGSSLVGGDSLSGSLSRAAGEHVGSYAIGQGSLANANYTITFNGANLAVTPKAITVNANTLSKVYGSADPGLTWQVAANGLVGGDVLNGSLVRLAGENTGSYAISQGSLANANYAITFNGANLTVTPKAITVNANAQSKVYGSADPVLGWQLAGGSSLVGGDTLSGNLFRAAGEHVGSYAIGQGSLANANYAITFNGANLTVTPKAITVNADAQSKVYGSADPVLGWQLAGGSSLVGSDTLSGSLSRVVGEHVGSYAIGQGSLANANYAITFNGANLSITPKAITVNADAQSKVYGSADPGLGWQLAGGSSLVGGDTLSGNLSRAAGEHVGSYAIGQGSLANANYTITFNGANLTVTPKAITVMADAKHKAYGSGDPELTWKVVPGSLVGEDTLAGKLGRARGEDLGEYAITQGSLGNANYEISFVGNTLSIAPMALSTIPGGQLWAMTRNMVRGLDHTPTPLPLGMASDIALRGLPLLSLAADFIRGPMPEGQGQGSH